MVISNFVLSFSIGNRSWRPANYRSCFSIPVGLILELLGSSIKSTVVHHSSVQLHHSSVLLCTIRQFSSAPFVSSVLHHSLATILRHMVMQFYNSASTNNLATYANTLCRLFNSITISYSSCDRCLQNISPYLSTHLFYCRDSASLY